VARAAAGLLALLLGVALGLPGCGGASARPAGPAAPVVRRYLPTDLRQAAQTAGVGVVVGTAADGASAIFELAPLPRQIDVAVVRQSAGVARVRLRVADGRGGAPAETPATSDQLAALRTLGKAVGDLALHLEAPPGDVSAARSSAALAVGWLAALTGASVRPDAIVLGRVTADGLLLPSPDLPTAVASARAAGMRVIVVPAGYAETGTETESETETEPGTETGTETESETETEPGSAAPASRVVPCLDLDEAYIAATDHQLPRTRAPEPSAPLVDPTRTASVIDELRRWAPADPAVTWHDLLVLEQRPRAPASAVTLARTGRASAERAAAADGPDETRRLAGAIAHVRIVAAQLIDALARAVDRGGDQLATAVESALAQTGVSGPGVSDRAAALHALLRERTPLELTYRARPQLLELLDRLAEAVADAWLLAAAPDLLAAAPDATGADGLATELAAVAPTARAGWQLWGLDDPDAPSSTAVAAAAARARLLGHRAQVVLGAVPSDVAAALTFAARLDGPAPGQRLLAWRWYRLAARAADAAASAGLRAPAGPVNAR
jgi:hypothetical protein